jgi:hypothetical protein
MMDETLRAAIDDCLSPGRFFARGGRLIVERSGEESLPWEVFLGHLLDRTQTRRTRTFESWNVVVAADGAEQGDALLSVLWDRAWRVLHVTRSILVYGWAPYESAPNVIESRETTLWRRELVGSIAVDDSADAEAIRRRLSHALFLGVIGVSRLPITSLESPLPGFSLGRFGYLPRVSVEAARPARTAEELLERGLTDDAMPLERVKVVELALRAAEFAAIPALAKSLLTRWSEIGENLATLPDLLCLLLGNVALSPYTSFADNFVALLHALAAECHLGPAPVIDVISFGLRHLVRHLTAFDLVTFHNRGANYPDALFLDVLLRAYGELIDGHPELFQPATSDDRRLESPPTMRVRRRALRQAWWVRKQYEGHPVPDAPTSPGENQRVLPAEFARVPDEQLQQFALRERRLFSDAPTETLLNEAASSALRQALADLTQDAELRELGLATFLDRPLGISKQPGEVDRTPLLSYTAFSRQIAHERLDRWRQWGWLDGERHAAWRQRLELLEVKGVSVAELSGPERPGVVALEDARRAAADFVFTATTRQSLDLLLACYDLSPLESVDRELVAWLRTSRQVLLIRTPGIGQEAWPTQLLTAYDEKLQPRLRLGIAPSAAPDGIVLTPSKNETASVDLPVLRVSVSPW